MKSNKFLKVLQGGRQKPRWKKIITKDFPSGSKIGKFYGTKLQVHGCKTIRRTQSNTVQIREINLKFVPSFADPVAYSLPNNFQSNSSPPNSNSVLSNQLKILWNRKRNSTQITRSYLSHPHFPHLPLLFITSPQSLQPTAKHKTATQSRMHPKLATFREKSIIERWNAKFDSAQAP